VEEYIEGFCIGGELAEQLHVFSDIFFPPLLVKLLPLLSKCYTTAAVSKKLTLYRIHKQLIRSCPGIINYFTFLRSLLDLISFFHIINLYFSELHAFNIA